MKRPARDALRLALGSALLGCALGVALLFTPLWRAVEYKLFDLYSVYSAPGPPELPIRIVAIDDYSLQQLDLPWPWPRRVYAELIDRLVAAGASVIAFDMQFSEPSTPEDDALLAEAIRNAGNVVLASRFDMQRTPLGTIRSNLDPLIALTEAGATVGHTDMDLAEDQVPRQFAEDQLVNDAPRPPLWREAVLTLIRVCGGCVEEPGFPPGSLIRYLGPPHSFAYFPAHEVLNEEPAALAEYLQDAIVFIGWDAGAGTDLSAQDAYPTPFTLSTRQLTPGVEIHATQLANVMLNTMIEPASRQQNLLLASGALLLMLPLLVWWHPLRSGALVLLLMIGVPALAFWCFREKQLWLATAAPLAGMALAFVANGTGAFLTERKRAGQIRGAFSMYVSEDVVKEMIAHPERLTLGGRRREVSVLFCDLAGFTTLSESLDPEAVGRVVNHYLSAMTRVVMRHGGTVDKFIGDAVMAFWGAPLDDPEHASHAVAAALGMQQAMRKLQPEFEALGARALELRVGINSGPAIVGNMGSDKRFDYTAIGDSVNLASRLEGANKAYGTPILIAGSTRALLGTRWPLRQVDRVRVKGKQQPVDVFTPCTDAALAALSERVWAAFLARDWDGARSRLAMLREIAPADDALAAQMEQRIAACASATLASDWDGSTALAKL